MGNPQSFAQYIVSGMRVLQGLLLLLIDVDYWRLNEMFESSQNRNINNKKIDDCNEIEVYFKM